MSTPIALMTTPAAKMGRRPVDSEAVTLRMHIRLLAAIDDWRRGQPDLPSRTEAIRRLVVLALEKDAKARKR
jgi:hypothetical protein